VGDIGGCAGSMYPLDTRTKLTQLGPSSMLYALLCVFDNTLQEQTFIGGTTILIELWKYTIKYITLLFLGIHL